MNELDQHQIAEINRRVRGEYYLNLPKLGPYEAFKMDEALMREAKPLPDWILGMFKAKKIGFYPDKNPRTVGKYWMQVGKSTTVQHQGDWFVLIQEDPQEIRRYTPEIFKQFYGAAEILAPDGDLEAPIVRTIEIYSPSAEEATLAGEISIYLEMTTEAWMTKAYYHYLEIMRDMLLTGKIESRMGAITGYIQELKGKGGQFKRSRYYELLTKGFELLDAK